MSLLRNRIVASYLIIAVGVLLFFGRRLLFPTFFELEGLPFSIAAPSVLNSCYREPTLLTCSDPVIVALTILGVTIVTGRGHLVAGIFTVMLAVLPTFFYFMLSPVAIVLIALLVIPPLVQMIMTLVFPDVPQR